MHTHKHEKGQILVLFVLGLVGLLGLTALAIDGSMVYSDRRFDQSVADSAALAGATAAADIVNGLSNQIFHCSHSEVITAMNNALFAAQARAASNGFSGANALALQDLSGQHGVYITCNDSVKPKYLAVEVRLSSETSTSFAHLILGENQIRNTVSSVVYLYPQRPVADGYAIVALDDACDAVLYDGNIANIVNDGGVFSNGGIKKAGASGYVQADNFTTVEATCGTNGITANNNFEFVGLKVNVDEKIKIEYDEIDCDDYPAASFDPSSKTWSAGRHPGFSLSNDEEIYLAPGLHCLTSGIRATARAKLEGIGVTLYFERGAFDGNGQANIRLEAPMDTEDAIPGMPGMLIFMDPDNPDSEVDMQGTSDAIYSGTVYVPSGNIDFGGDSATDTSPQYTTQFIGETVKMHGSPSVTVNYDESAFAREPARLDQYR